MEKLALSAEEAAEVLGLSITKVYEYMRRADFPTVILGGRRLVNAARLQAWLDRHTVWVPEEDATTPADSEKITPLPATGDLLRAGR